MVMMKDHQQKIIEKNQAMILGDRITRVTMITEEIEVVTDIISLEAMGESIILIIDRG